MGENHRKTTRQAKLSRDASIGIIGCGIAGLSTAISLAQSGFLNVKVFERDPCEQSRREGFGLTLSYNPKGPLERLGILEEVAQQDCPSRSHYVFSPEGRILGYYGNAFRVGKGFGQRGNLRVPRRKLLDILVRRFSLLLSRGGDSESGIFWNHTLTSIKENKRDGKVQVEFCQQPKTSNLVVSGETKKKTESSGNKKYTRTSLDLDFVVAADGVRSFVVGALAPQCQPRPLNVMIILGIADFDHPLTTERGFYTVDGTHRFFVMPYSGDKFSSDKRVMWQASFRYESFDKENLFLQHYKDPAFLKDLVLKRFSGFHEPVCSMISSTPIQTIWGTPLVDRDPLEIKDAFQEISRVVVVGDALHAMSPFKGQGANQSLLDGSLVADAFLRAKCKAAVRIIWREIIQRCHTVVLASREAALFWHSFACVDNDPQPAIQKQPNLCHFAGVPDKFVGVLLTNLTNKKVNAGLSDRLDEAVRRVIEAMGIGFKTDTDSDMHPKIDDKLCCEIIQLASRGALPDLRRLSMVQASAIQHARDDNGRSCLHWAVKNGHYMTARWLLTEAMVDPMRVDHDGRSAIQNTTDPTIISLFQLELFLRKT